MAGLLNRIAELSDDQLDEGTRVLSDQSTSVAVFMRGAMLMERERRLLQKSVKGDLPGHPFRGNQWSGGGSSTSGLGLSAALDALTGRQPANAATSVRKIDSSSVKSDSKLGKGGVNESRVVEIEGEGKFCFKPDSGENPGVHPAYRGHQSTNEVAASVIDSAMGLDMVAKTEMVEINGKKGSLQKWVNNDAKVAKELIEYDGEDVKSTSKLDSTEGVSDMMYMDALIGNTDRHYGNWLVKDGKAKLIDNGMSMADNMEYGDDLLRYRSLEHATTAVRGMHRMSPKFKEGLDKMLANKDQVDKQLEAAGVGAAQRQSMWKRAEYIKKARFLGFGDSTLRDLGRLAEGRQLFASVGEIDVKGDLPGHPFRGNQWEGGGQGDSDYQSPLEDGVTVKAYHFTPEGGIDEFRPGTMFAMNPMSEGALRRGLGRDGESGEFISVEITPDIPMDLSDWDRGRKLLKGSSFEKFGKLSSGQLREAGFKGTSDLWDQALDRADVTAAIIKNASKTNVDALSYATEKDNAGRVIIVLDPGIVKISSRKSPPILT